MDRLRHFHTQVKANLLSVYAALQENHLDLGCGPGKDVHLWRHARIHQARGVDINPEAVADAELMIQKQGDPHLMLYNFTVADVTTTLDNTVLYDCISCMYSLQHMWGKETYVRNLLQNVSTGLRLHGHFVGVVLDSTKVREWVASKEHSDVFHIEPLRGFHSTSPFGNKYTLTLGSKVSEEYLVNIDTLTSLAKEYGLYFVESKPVNIPVEYQGREFTHLHRTFVFMQTTPRF